VGDLEVSAAAKETTVADTDPDIQTVRDGLHLDYWTPDSTRGKMIGAALAALDRLAARLAAYDHLRSEWSYRHDRGDHLVYRSEWEEFVAWRKSGGAKALEAAEAERDEARRTAAEDGQLADEFAAEAELAKARVARQEALGE
jgi:hypothetical protein